MHCRDGVVTRSIQEIAEANFMDEIHAKLKLSGYLSMSYLLLFLNHFVVVFSIDDVYRVQSVAWPHLMRGQSLILIGAANTGKTWTYVPAVCSLLVVSFLQTNFILRSTSPFTKPTTFFVFRSRKDNVGDSNQGAGFEGLSNFLEVKGC